MFIDDLQIKWRRLRPVLALLAIALHAGPLTPVDRDGYARMLQALRGKVILVDFWATWCEPCREELPKLVTLARKLARKNFQLITISADEPEHQGAAEEMLDKMGVRAPRYLKRADDDMVFIDSIDKKWSGALPALFLYDASGSLVATFIGESEAADIEAAVVKALR